MTYVIVFFFFLLDESTTMDHDATFFVAGTALVTFSFAFIFNKCFACGQSRTDWELFVWYAPYVIVFQIGWAAVQVIFSHFVC